MTDIKTRLPYSGGPFLSFWLRSLGLGKYEAAFRENHIDATVLPGPSSDLKTAPTVVIISRDVKIPGGARAGIVTQSSYGIQKLAAVP